MLPKLVFGSQNNKKSFSLSKSPHSEGITNRTA